MLTNTIEDCLEILAGFRKESDGFSLMKEDYTICLLYTSDAADE